MNQHLRTASLFVLVVACAPTAEPERSPTTPETRPVATATPVAEQEPEDRRVVIEDTEIFILTDAVEGLLPADTDAAYTVDFGDCLTPPDDKGCCWVELTACLLPDDSADADRSSDTAAATDDRCNRRRAHGCKD